MSLRRSIAWSFFGQLVAFIISFAGSVALARTLTPYEMGVFAFGFALSSILAQMQNLGLPNYIISDRDLSDEKLGTVFSVNAGISVVLSLVLFGAAGTLALVGNFEIAYVLTVLAPIPLLSIVDIVPLAMLHRTMMFHGVALVQGMRALVGTGVAVAFALMGFSYASMAWGNLAGSLSATLLTLIVGRAYVWVKPGLSHSKEIVRFGFRILLIAGIDNLSNRFNEVLVGRLIGLTPLGIYSRAASMTLMVYDGLYGIIVRVFFPALADYDRTMGNLREPYLRACKILTGIMWPAWMGLAVLATPLVVLLYGAKWAESGPLLSLLCLSQVLLGAFPMHWELFIIKKRTQLQMVLEPIFTVFALAIFSVGCLISLEAAAASRILVGVVWICIYVRPVLSMSGLAPADFLSAYRDSALLTLAATAPAILIQQWHGWSADIGWIELLLSVALGIVVWACTAIALRHPIRAELEHARLWAANAAAQIRPTGG